MRDEKSNRSYSVRNVVYTCPANHEGENIYIKGWIAKPSDAHPIVFIHDYGSTADECGLLATELALLGMNSYAFDLRSFSTGRATSLQDIGKETLQVLAWIKHLEKGKKPVVIAVGLGLYIFLAIQKHIVKYCQNVILMDPFLGLKEVPAKLELWFAKSVSELLPSVPMPRPWIPKRLRPHFCKKRFTLPALVYFDLLQLLSTPDQLLHSIKLPALIFTNSMALQKATAPLTRLHEENAQLTFAKLSLKEEISSTIATWLQAVREKPSPG